ncbi:MAG: hypothetical protein WAN72_24695 [Candidatus Acidiferrales bacterium]
MSAEAELQGKNERLELLLNLTTTITSSLDLRDTLRTIAANIREVDAFKSLPIDFLPSASAVSSLDAYREYQKAIWLPAVSDTSRFEAYVRDLVVIQSDGTVRPRMSDGVTQEVLRTTLTDQRDYTKVRTPALAIYADTFFDVQNGDPAQRAKNLDWEQKYMAPFRAAAIERVRRELPSVEIVKVPGTPKGFVFTSRQEVVSAMQSFLGGTEKG